MVIYLLLLSFFLFVSLFFGKEAHKPLGPFTEGLSRLSAASEINSSATSYAV